VDFDEGNPQLQTAMFSKQLIPVVLCVLQALAASSPLVPVKKTNNPVPGQYVVTLKDGVDRVVSVSSLVSDISSDSTITHEWDIINGFAGTFTDADLEILRSLPDVVSIEEAGYVQIQAIKTQ